MQPANLDIETWQGDFFSKAINIGTLPVDLTDAGTIVRMQVRKTASTTDAVLTASTDNGRISVSAADAFTVYVGADVMAAVGEAGKTFTGVYDLEIVPGGVEAGAFKILYGAFVINGEVTR